MSQPLTTTTLPYWGQINALISQQAVSLFTTKVFDKKTTEQATHSNQTSQAKLYRVDSSSDHPTLTALALPVGMDGLTALSDGTVMLIGRDGQLYQSDWQAKKVTQVSTQATFELISQTASEDDEPSQHLPTAVAIASFGEGVAVLYPNHLIVWAYQKHKLGDCIANIRLDSVQQTSDKTNTTGLSINQATSLAVSADGDWLVVGDNQGLVSSFHVNAECTAVLHSSSELLHQGAITALCFEPIAQQFFSAGADKQLLRTHVQGKLQGIDRGKASQHTEMIRSMVVSEVGKGERLYTGSDDKSVKSWQFDKGQPNTCKDDLVKVRLLSVCQYVGQASVLAVGTDQSLRFIPVDSEGKLTNVAHVIKDGYQRLTDLLSDKEDKAFKEGLALLAEHSDNNRLNIVSKILEKSNDGYRSEQLAKWLATSQLPKTTHQLEQLLGSHSVEKVRAIAFEALKAQAQVEANDTANSNSNTTPNPLRYLQLALDSKFVDVNELAIAEYIAVAQSNPSLHSQIIAVLQVALSHHEARIRKQALSALETLLPSDSPQADLLALATGNSDVQQAGLIRLYQRGMLNHFEVKRQLVLLQNDNNAVVRQTAFYVSVLSQPTLAEALAKLDDNLTRTLQDFSDFRLLPKTNAKANQNSANQGNSQSNANEVNLSLDIAPLDETKEQNQDQAKSKTKAKQKAVAVPTLDSQALEPLLQGLSNSYTDISFRSAYSLALLHDDRAFGALMRLMHDNDDTTRIGVAKAFAELGQQDGLTVLPLLLDDKNATVRQVAMQSYGKLSQQHGVSLLDWASVGFASREQDVHQQALSVLLTALQNPDNSDSQGAVNTQGIDTLSQALNDPFEPIRQEVVKVLINRLNQVSGEADSSQRKQAIFGLLKQSRFVDVHQVTLDEWQTLLKQSPQASDSVVAMLAEFLDNPFQAIRQGAFDIALREHKRIAVKTLLSLAFNSQFVDTRQQALNLLSSQKTADLMPLLSALFNDDNGDLRLQALKVALDYGDPQVLATALQSPYSDIQLATAQALAKQGHGDSYQIFEHFLNQPMPEMADEKTKWQKNIIEALRGVADLADGRGFAWFDKYLHDANAEFGKTTDLASQVMWVSRGDNLERLAEWQNDERSHVKQGASLALAVWGDKRGEMLLNDDKQANTLSATQWLQARVGLGVSHANQLRPVLGKADTELASRVLLAFYDLLLNPTQPKRLLEALAFADSDTALLCAGVIARFADSTQAWQYLADTLNRQLQQRREPHKTKQEAVWSLDVPTLQQLAQCVVFGEPLIKAQAVSLLTPLSQNLAYEVWQSRYLRFVQLNQALLNDTNRQYPLVAHTNPAHEHQWQALAFGAWLGILRQTDYRSVSVAEQAMRALLNLAQHPHWQDSVQRAFIPLLNHQNYNVRELAWQGLQDLGLPSERLGEHAMSSPHIDMVQKGLGLWLTSFEQNHNATEANQQLQGLLQTNSAVLTQEAYRLLVQRVGALSAGEMALASYYLPLRSQVVNEWRQITTPERQADRLALLNLASANDDWQTRFSAISQLFDLPVALPFQQPSKQLVGASFDTDLLIRGIQLWQHSQDMGQQRAVTNLLSNHVAVISKKLATEPTLANPLLALLDSPQRKVELGSTYNLLGDTRSTAFVPALMQRYLDKSDERADIVKTLTKISGFDQPIEDFYDDYADKRWLERQYPRHVAVLLNLAQQLLQHTDYLRFTNLLYSLSWANDASLNPQIDKLLQRAYSQMPSQHTAKIVEAMAYRADKRQGDVAGLRKALGNKDAEVQFLSAEGLAKRGIKDGFAVLMATIDYNTDGELRRRAVLALGELGDEQAYDKLIKLADDPAHYLQDVASEALGHLGQTEYGQRIFSLLQTHLQQVTSETPAIEHWINGLRWLNTYDSWQQIRDFIKRDEADPYTFWSSIDHAIKTLQYHVATDDIGTANRNLLLKLIRSHTNYSRVEQSVLTAQILFDNEPNTVYAYDWAVLESLFPTILENQSQHRISQFASLDELLAFINDYPQLVQRNHGLHLEYYNQDTGEQVIQALMQAILERDKMPASDLHKLLVSSNPSSQQLGLRYLTQHPQDYWQNEVETGLWQQLTLAKTVWQQLVAQVSEQPSLASTAYNRSVNADTWQRTQENNDTTVSQLLWLLLRFSPINSAHIGDTLSWLLNQQQQTIVQAVPVLATTLNGWLKQSLLALLVRPADELSTAQPWQEVLRQVAYWSNAELQQLAQQLLAHAQTSKAEKANKADKKSSLIEQVKGIFGKRTTPDASNQSLSPSQQLIQWVQQSDVEALYQWGSDISLAENLRISAIEGLGQVSLTQADAVVQRLSQLQQHDSDADIQRTAFSVLRRYQRRLTPKMPKHTTRDLNVG
ncbi:MULTISPECIES: HEAT repeat domain-containing protein [unclassified Moraxella]|uniref:HEAT repeat domain-containing protein n=1 Tax=unclassified Moraxella TaxID=2685852 RepID=UPI003AF4DFD1